MRLDCDGDVDENILYADLNDLASLIKENLEYSLCRFICKVRKSRDSCEYPGHTLYQLSYALQNYLKKKKLNWRIVHGDEFCDFNRVLDRVMKVRSENAGTVTKQVEIISLEFENKLWSDNILGEETPDKLRGTVLYLLGVNCALRAGDEHYNLRQPGGCVTSQLSFEPNSCNVKCLVYCEDTVTKRIKGAFET